MGSRNINSLLNGDELRSMLDELGCYQKDVNGIDELLLNAINKLYVKVKILEEDNTTMKNFLSNPIYDYTKLPLGK